MRIGLHVSIAGNIYESIDRAKALKCQTMQIFSRNPRGWRALKLKKKSALEFKKRRKLADIFPVLVHIPYIINLASPDKKLYQKSIEAYIEDIKRADLLGAEYFVTHLGSHVGQGEEQGLKRFTEAINIILKKAEPQTMILLETTAGSGSSLGYKFEHLSEIIRGVKNKEKVGVCLDTQHIYAAGYDIVNDLEKTIKEFGLIIGLGKLKAVHLNDSKSALGSKVDRHEHIGKGKIGLSAFKRILNHPKLNSLPFVMETPKDKPDDEIKNIKTVRSLCRKK